MPKPKVNLLLDSGAFSAWRRRASIDVDAYADFILEHRHLFEYVVNLDCIPGAWGKAAGPTETEDAARKGYSNLRRLRKRGVDAMPVFHQGESFVWLDRMVADGYDWIGLGTLKDRPVFQRRIWLDEVFGHLCGDDGYPRIRTHGFGVTSPDFIWRFPWYSVDSATWLRMPGYGRIIVPPKTARCEFDYTVAPNYMFVSKTRPGKDPALPVQRHPNMHYDTAGESRRRHVRRYVESLGLDMNMLQDQSSRYRTLMCAMFFREVEKQYKPRPFNHQGNGFFSSSPAGTGVSDCPWSEVRIFLTCSANRGESEMLTRAGVHDRLISYFLFINGRRSFDWGHYVATGLLPKTPIKRKKLLA